MGDVTNPQQSETVISGTNKSEPLYNVFPQVAFFLRNMSFPESMQVWLEKKVSMGYDLLLALQHNRSIINPKITDHVCCIPWKRKPNQKVVSWLQL